MPLPCRKTVKGPGLSLSTCFRFSVSGGQPSERQMLCCPQLPSGRALGDSAGTETGKHLSQRGHSGVGLTPVSGGSQLATGTQGSAEWGVKQATAGVRDPMMFPMGQVGKRLLRVFPLTKKVFSHISEIQSPPREPLSGLVPVERRCKTFPVGMLS